MKKTLFMLSTLLLLLGAAPAFAVCNLSAANANFGTVTSFTLTGAASTTSTNFNVDCGSALLTLASADFISVQLVGASASASNRATMIQGADAIPIQLCSAQGCSGSELQILGTVFTKTSNQLAALNVGGAGRINFSIPLYLQTVNGAVVAAGDYIVTLNLLVKYSVCTGLAGIGAICLGTVQQSPTAGSPLSLTVGITVSRDCTTITPTSQTISFGNQPLVSSFTTQSGTLAIVCTKGSSYNVGITNGNNPVGNQRYMASGANRLAYQIYQGTGTTYWGPTSPNRVASSAGVVGADLLTRTFTFNARVLSTQNTPVAGNYSDRVSVDVAF